MKQGSNETLGDTLSALKVIDYFFWLKQIKIHSQEAPGSITYNHKNNHKTTTRFCWQVYMTLMFKDAKFEACNIHTSENNRGKSNCRSNSQKFTL